MNTQINTLTLCENCPKQSFYRSIFRTEYGELLCKSVGIYGPEKTPYFDPFDAVSNLPSVHKQFQGPSLTDIRLDQIITDIR